MLPSTIFKTDEHEIWILQPHNVSAERWGLKLGYVERKRADILPGWNIQLQDVTNFPSSNGPIGNQRHRESEGAMNQE